MYKSNNKVESGNISWKEWKQVDDLVSFFSESDSYVNVSDYEASNGEADNVCIEDGTDGTDEAPTASLPPPASIFIVGGVHKVRLGGKRDNFSNLIKANVDNDDTSINSADSFTDISTCSGEDYNACNKELQQSSGGALPGTGCVGSSDLGGCLKYSRKGPCGEGANIM